MASTKYFTYIAVITPEENKNIVKYVTHIEGRTAHWEAGKPARKFNEAWAKDVALGLCMNGFNAVVVKALDGLELSNPAE